MTRLIISAVLLVVAARADDNMNGRYPFSATPGGVPGLLPNQYKDYPGGVEHFDVYSPPITTLYSQVWWQPLAPVELPPDVVRRYNNTEMAIVGWEIDQVRRTPDGDVSVPISASYNHHYGTTIAGAGARFEKVVLDGPSDPRAAELRAFSSHGHAALDQPQYVVRGGESVQIQSGNGGEYRKTFHGFPPGFALVIGSPTALQVSPMQIDTWHRDAMNLSAGASPPPFVAGPLPRASLAPPGADHSGLLECPMTTRLTARVDVEYALLSSGACDAPILSFHECFEAAATAARNATPASNASGADATRPPGCSVAIDAGAASAFFNELDAGAAGAACRADARCVCPVDPPPFGEATGALLYHPTAQPADVGEGAAASFGPSAGKLCAPWPATTLADMRNPTCDVRHYRGGQWACKHMWSLLDADQPIPWEDTPLVLHHKYRFWAQPYDATAHTRVTLGESVGSLLLLGSPWEYDVPACDRHVAGCALVNGTWIHTVTGNALGQGRYVTLNNHCHAPACLSTEVYACAKGTPLDACNTTNGELVCRTAPVYGGTGAPELDGTRFDETGYAAIADCLWGASEHGLEPPPDLTDVPLHIVKTSNATFAHYGEMSGGQPWIVSSPDV